MNMAKAATTASANQERSEKSQNQAQKTKIQDNVQEM